VEHSSIQDLNTEDLITPTDMVVTLSHSGYIKSQPLSEYRAQKRGGRGKQATATKEDDWVDQLFIANTHDYILCFQSGAALLAQGLGSSARLARLPRPSDHQYVPAAGGRKDQRRSAADRQQTQLPCRPVRLHGHQHGNREERRRWTNSTTRAKAASLLSTSTTATT
jgi:hypothetical protein